MDKKIGVVITIIIILIAISTGCFGSEAPKPKKTELVETSGNMNGTTGWLESAGSGTNDGDQIYLPLTGDIPIFLNDTNVYSITFTLNFKDFDTSHSSTDQNSPEDYVEASIDGLDVTGSGTTPCMITLTIKANKTDEEQEYIQPELNIHVEGKCYCEITYPMTNRPSALRLFTRDQGVAYELSAAYKYHEIK